MNRAHLYGNRLQKLISLRTRLDAEISAERRLHQEAVEEARPYVEPKRLREWARANGYQVAVRGSIPAFIREEYFAALDRKAC